MVCLDCLEWYRLVCRCGIDLWFGVVSGVFSGCFRLELRFLGGWFWIDLRVLPAGFNFLWG